LRCLSIQRKKIGDDDGADMIRSLVNNTTLEKLELEGNNFGPKTAREVANLLRKNRFIKHINLESNNLTNSGKDTEGVIELARVKSMKMNVISIRLWVLAGIETEISFILT